MNTVQRIAKNTIVLLAANVTSKVFGFFYIMYTARYLGTEVFGFLTFALAFTGIFGVFTNMGLGTLMVREVAKDKSLVEKYLGNITMIKLILAIFTFGIIAVLINFLNYPEQTIKVVYLIALSVIFKSFSEMFYSIFRAYEKMEYQSLGQILSSALMLSSALFAISQGFNVIGFASIYFIVSVIILAYSFVLYTLKFAKLKIEIDWDFWKQCIKKAWPMGGMAICIMIYFRIDAVMLSLMKGDVAVGLYGAAYRLSEISVIIPSMFIASIFPIMSKYHKGNKNSFIKTHEKSVKYLFSLALPMALTVTLLAKPIINLIYGNEFAGSVRALQILIWASAIMYVNWVLGTTFVTANRQMVNFKIAIVAAILNIVLNLLLIPKYSYLGASAATVATEAFGFFVGIFFLNKLGYKTNIVNIYLPPLVASFAFVITEIILLNMNIDILIVLTICIIIYGLVTYKLGITKDDKQLIKKIFNLSNIKILEKEDL
jgi:O-antigen/teichoic acid export membrane protein